MPREIKRIRDVKPLLEREAERLHEELSGWLTPDGEREVLTLVFGLVKKDEEEER